MRHSALLAWRSPPSWALTLPLDLTDPAGTGETPQRWAHAPSECNRSGLSPGRHHQCGCGVGSHAEEIEELGHGGDEERFDPGVELGELIIECLDPVRQRGERRLGGSRHWIGRSCRPKRGPFGDEGRSTSLLAPSVQTLPSRRLDMTSSGIPHTNASVRQSGAECRLRRVDVLGEVAVASARRAGRADAAAAVSQLPTTGARAPTTAANAANIGTAPGVMYLMWESSGSLRETARSHDRWFPRRAVGGVLRDRLQLVQLQLP